jgi:hypothetical protein
MMKRFVDRVMGVKFQFPLLTRHGATIWTSRDIQLDVERRKPITLHGFFE